MAARSPGVTGKCYCHCLGDIIMLTKTVLNHSLETECLGARQTQRRRSRRGDEDNGPPNREDESY